MVQKLNDKQQLGIVSVNHPGKVIQKKSKGCKFVLILLFIVFIFILLIFLVLYFTVIRHDIKEQSILDNSTNSDYNNWTIIQTNTTKLQTSSFFTTTTTQKPISLSNSSPCEPNPCKNLAECTVLNRTTGR